MNRVSAIVCAYNESATLDQVIQELLAIPLISQIIVINDGSTDNSASILNKYEQRVTVITNDVNSGKGVSVARGLRVATEDTILLLDADILNYTAKDLNLLTEPVLTSPYDFTIKIPDTGLFMKISVSGIRCYRKADLLPLIPALEKSTRYGLEFLLNKEFKNKRGTFVQLTDYRHIKKFEKYSLPKAILEYSKELFSLLKQLLFTRNGGAISSHIPTSRVPKNDILD